MIGVLWKPAALVPKDFKVCLPHLVIKVSGSHQVAHKPSPKVINLFHAQFI